LYRADDLLIYAARDFFTPKNQGWTSFRGAETMSYQTASSGRNTVARDQCRLDIPL
jgi:hypothetical protein